MDVCLEILEEQVKNIKEGYYYFLGAFTNLFEFSNYTVMDSKDMKSKDTKQYKKINDKLIKLRSNLLELRDEISNL